MNFNQSLANFLQFFIVFLVILFIHRNLNGQEEFNNSKDFKIELKASKAGSLTSVGSDFFYRTKKHSYFAGIGLGFHSSSHSTEPILKIGYRKYPGKNLKPLKFMYQTFLYYSSNHYNFYKPQVERYLTANYGVGLNYDFNNKFSAGLSSNIGWGWNFLEKSGIFTLFPAQLTIGYTFN